MIKNNRFLKYRKIIHFTRGIKVLLTKLKVWLIMIQNIILDLHSKIKKRAYNFNKKHKEIKLLTKILFQINLLLEQRDSLKYLKFKSIKNIIIH